MEDLKKMIITDSIKYVGVDDKALDLFEGQYAVPEGVSYNSYVILDEKIAVMDTVDKRCVCEWEKNLDQVLGTRTPDYLVIQHVEPDHAGSIAEFVKKYPETLLVGNAKTFTMLSQFFDFSLEGKTITVKEGDTLELGNHMLTFIMAPMVHWPEVMVSYENKEQVLFSADGFGKFGALNLKCADDIFNGDSVKEQEWFDEAERYYFNIVGKYGTPVQTLLKKAAGLDIKYICPLHGPVLKENIKYYIDLYDTWSSYRAKEDGVLVAYASFHGNTADAAKKAAEFISSKNKTVVVRDLARDDMSQVVAEAFRYDKLILAATTYDAGIAPVMHDFLTHLQSKAYQSRKVAVIENGSWAPTAGKQIRTMLEAMKNISIAEKCVTIRSVMKEQNVNEIEQMCDELLTM